MSDQQDLDGLQYNSAGYLIPPQSGGIWTFIVGIYTVSIPLLAHVEAFHSPISPVFLEKLSLFQFAIAYNVLSIDQIANVQLLYAVLIFQRIVEFPFFFKKYATKYDEQQWPPEPLRKLWPSQICGRFYLAAFFVCMPIVVGVLLQHGLNVSDLKSHGFSLLVLILGAGILFLGESIYATILYLYFYFRYWRHSPKTRSKHPNINITKNN